MRRIGHGDPRTAAKTSGANRDSVFFEITFHFILKFGGPGPRLPSCLSPLLLTRHLLMLVRRGNLHRFYGALYRR